MKITIYLFVCGVGCAFAHPIEEDQAEWTMISTDDGHFKMINIEEAEVHATLQEKNVPVFFYLYTRLNPNNHGVIVNGSPYSLINSRFNPKHPTRIIIHGYKGSLYSGVNTLIRDAYLAHGDFNVIIVDWNVGALEKNGYIEAMKNVPNVGKQVADFIDFLDECGYPLMDNIYLIGYSLGAHVSGIAGRSAKATVNTIFALDAAGPGWLSDPNRVNKGDAKYVQAIHTNDVLGYPFAYGDATFYPNWLNNQPGCGIDIACSHARSYQYFAESLESPNRFVGKNCKSLSNIIEQVCPGEETALMGGEPSNHNVKGNWFYVPTNSAYPFATGKV